MRNRAAWGVAVAAVALGGGLGATMLEGPKSGLPVGEFTSAFNVLDVTGPNKGRSLCYR